MSGINTLLYLMGSLQGAWEMVLKMPSMRNFLCETMYLRIGGDAEGSARGANFSADLVVTWHHAGLVDSGDSRVKGLRVSLYLPWDEICAQVVVYQWLQSLLIMDHSQTSVATTEVVGKNGIRKEFNITMHNHSVPVDNVLRLVDSMVKASDAGKLSWRASFSSGTFSEYSDQCLEFRYMLEVDGSNVALRVSSEHSLPIIIAVHEKCGFTAPRDPDTGEAYPSTLLLPLD